MKRIQYILIFFGLIILSFVIPTILWIRDYFTNFKDPINSTILTEFSTFQNSIISFWSLILNIVLVIIAYKAFKNFDVKKQFHNKQLDIVSELATSISSTVLSNMMYRMSTDPNGKKHQIATGFSFSFFEIGLGFDYSKFNLMCVKSNNIENTFPFLKYKNHPLLPKSISDELNKLYRPLQYRLTVDKEKLKVENYVLISVKKELNPKDFSDDWIYEFYKTPTDFNKDVLSLRNSIINWYKEYGAKDLNI